MAEADVRLYASKDNGEIELIFDDKDMMKKNLSSFTESTNSQPFATEDDRKTIQ